MIEDDDHEPDDHEDPIVTMAADLADEARAEKIDFEKKLAAHLTKHPRSWGEPFKEDQKNRPARMARFLEAFAQTGRVTHSARYAGVDRGTVYDWKKRDPEFARQWEEAEGEYKDGLMAELHRRGVIGVKKFAGVSKDGKVYFDIVASDRLFELELKRVEPAFRDRFDVTSGDAAISGVLIVPPAVTLDQFVEEAEKLRRKFQEKGYM